MTVACLILWFSTPSIAQSFPRIEVGVGFANLASSDSLNFFDTPRHIGLTAQADLNFRRWFGVENYAALYGLTQHWGSTNIKMVSEVVGAKFTGRYGRANPYVVGGVGVSYATHDFGYGSVFPTERSGGGFDIAAANMLAFRFEIGIMRFKLNGWETTPNILGGVVFRSRH